MPPKKIFLFEIKGKSIVPFAKSFEGSVAKINDLVSKFAKELYEEHKQPVKYWECNCENAVIISK